MSCRPVCPGHGSEWPSSRTWHRFNVSWWGNTRLQRSPWKREWEREARNIFLRVSTGTIMSILSRAIGSCNRARIWLRKGERYEEGSCVSSREMLTLIFIDSRGHVTEVSSNVFRRFNRSHRFLTKIHVYI